jgi:GNAT superfamily N-acetyltransferase
MPRDDQNILHIAPATELEEERIHTLLRAYNARHWPKNTPSLSLTARVEGELAGGIVAYLVADTVEVEYLFVQERFRGRGIARPPRPRRIPGARARRQENSPQHAWLPGSGPTPAPRLPRGSYHRRRTRHQLAHLPQAHLVAETHNSSSRPATPCTVTFAHPFPTYTY